MWKLFVSVDLCMYTSINRAYFDAYSQRIFRAEKSVLLHVMACHPSMRKPIECKQELCSTMA